MLDDLLGFAVIGGYIGMGYFITRLIRKWVIVKNQYLKLAIMSCSYALIFGVGIIGSGGDPGFAFPCPVVVAALWGIWDWIPTRFFVTGVIIPFVFWWVVIFAVMIVRLKLKQRSDTRLTNIRDAEFMK
ncbi:MAG TPA: hypothetical protein VE978_28240 [Chitinophagales bacterium]|nr:hypothetical protein [Chitinophagales bacterium]